MKLKLFTVFFMGIFLSTIQSQTLNIIPIVGSSSDFTIANIKNLTFADGNLVVANTGSTATFALAGNRKILFTTNVLSAPINTLFKSSFYLYVNPLTSILTISNLGTNAIIFQYEIIALDGRVLKSKNRLNSNSEQVFISDLPQSLYFCRITTNTTTQTIKFLKQ